MLAAARNWGVLAERGIDRELRTPCRLQLGLVICRGSAVVAIAPAQGLEEIANPFLVQEVPCRAALPQQSLELCAWTACLKRRLR